MTTYNEVYEVLEVLVKMRYLFWLQKCQNVSPFHQACQNDYIIV